MLSLLFGFHGRINRAKYWFATLLSSFGGFVLLGLMMAISSGGAIGASTRGAKLAVLTNGLMMMSPVFALIAWMGLAIQVKRFHDRGRSGWVAALPFAVTLAMTLAGFGGVASNMTPETVVASVEPYMGVLWLINLAFFIDLGCLGSREGPNRYGDPPGPSGVSAPAGKPRAPAASMLLGAQTAMDRAIAARDVMPAAKSVGPAPSLAAPEPASTGPRIFGRRATR